MIRDPLLAKTPGPLSLAGIPVELPEPFVPFPHRVDDDRAGLWRRLRHWLRPVVISKVAMDSAPAGGEFVLPGDPGEDVERVSVLQEQAEPFSVSGSEFANLTGSSHAKSVGHPKRDGG